MAECNHCSAHVSKQFVLVFGDASGQVHACLACAAKAGIGQTTRRRAD